MCSVFACADLDLPDQEFSLHDMGVDHLLTVLPVVFEGRAMPEIVVIGAEIGDISPLPTHSRHRWRPLSIGSSVWYNKNA